MTFSMNRETKNQRRSVKGDVLKDSGIESLAPGSLAGQVIRRRLETHSGLSYFLYIPHTLGSNPKLLVSVHGISRNARQHVNCFTDLAEKYGIVIVAPYFSRKKFSGYQRLGWLGQKRADLAFQEIVADVRGLTGAKDKIHLFGYSGGAQFAHRYTMAYPEQIERLVVGAAGWYTFPDETRRYPFGTRLTPKFPDIIFDADKYLQVPIRVVVGGWDIQLDEAINRRPKIDRQQGKTRMERARRWIFAMSQKAVTRGIAPHHELIVLGHCGHDFRACVTQGQLGKHVFEFCFGARTSAASTRQPAKRDIHRTPEMHTARPHKAIAGGRQ